MSDAGDVYSTEHRFMLVVRLKDQENLDMAIGDLRGLVLRADALLRQQRQGLLANELSQAFSKVSRMNEALAAKADYLPSWLERDADERQGAREWDEANDMRGDRGDEHHERGMRREATTDWDDAGDFTRIRMVMEELERRRT